MLVDSPTKTATHLDGSVYMSLMCFVAGCCVLPQPCQSQLARSKAVVRQLANGVTLGLELLTQRPDLPTQIKELIETAKIFKNIRGNVAFSSAGLHLTLQPC